MRADPVATATALPFPAGFAAAACAYLLGTGLVVIGVPRVAHAMAVVDVCVGAMCGVLLAKVHCCTRRQGPRTARVPGFRSWWRRGFLAPPTVIIHVPNAVMVDPDPDFTENVRPPERTRTRSASNGDAEDHHHHRNVAVWSAVMNPWHEATAVAHMVCAQHPAATVAVCGDVSRDTVCTGMPCRVRSLLQQRMRSVLQQQQGVPCPALSVRVNRHTDTSVAVWVTPGLPLPSTHGNDDAVKHLPHVVVGRMQVQAPASAAPPCATLLTTFLGTHTPHPVPVGLTLQAVPPACPGTIVMGTAQGLRAALLQDRRALPLIDAGFSRDGEMDVPSGGTLVFIDLILPTGDGRDVCHSLRHRGCAAFIVAVVPGTGIMHNQDHLARVGFDAMVLAPVEPGEALQALLSHALGARHTPGQ